METLLDKYSPSDIRRTPHSLGKLIEWKHAGDRTERFADDVVNLAPHSLGKLIEWKLRQGRGCQLGGGVSPHSLGKLIEWKLAD
jgi:hypothetical protein